VVLLIVIVLHVRAIGYFCCGSSSRGSVPSRPGSIPVGSTLVTPSEFGEFMQVSRNIDHAVWIFS
jgi:hypothetical protein